MEYNQSKNFDIGIFKGLNVHEIEGSVQSPSGKQERCQVVDLGQNK